MTTHETYPYAAAKLGGAEYRYPNCNLWGVFDNSSDDFGTPLGYPNHVEYTDEAEAQAVADKLNLDLGPGVADKLYAEALAANGGK